MKNVHYLLLGFLTCATLWSCDIINPDEDIPSYIYVEPFTLTTDIVTQGTNNHKITEAWVFADGDFLGAYDLPAEIPVLKEGTVDVRIEAGIKENGISSVPEIYPYYKPYLETVELAPNETKNIQPTTTYTPETVIGFVEDFEDNRPRIFVRSQLGETDLERTQEDVFEGDYSGKLTLKRDTVPVIEIASGLEYSNLMANGVYVYLEVNYKSDCPVLWGISGITDPITGIERYIEVGFAAKDTWNKIYFNLSANIHNSQLEDYRITLQAIITEGSPDVSEVYLDNIKLVHF